jgi:hypothetical protein
MKINTKEENGKKAIDNLLSLTSNKQCVDCGTLEKVYFRESMEYVCDSCLQKRIKEDILKEVFR